LFVAFDFLACVMTSFTRDHPVIPGDPDPAHSIELWATSFPVPRWVAEKTYRQCYHCQDPFKSNQQHNCRLCGEIFCSRCTGKYHLPDQYDLKGKIGLMRVCFGCVVTCNRLRQASHNLPLDRVNKTIDVPDWQADAAYVACNKCAKKERGPHNCRLCGLLYCDACASKINIDVRFSPQFSLFSLLLAHAHALTSSLFISSHLSLRSR
jgi:hypothetical protein